VIIARILAKMLIHVFRLKECNLIWVMRLSLYMTFRIWPERKKQLALSQFINLIALPVVNLILNENNRLKVTIVWW